MIQKALFTSKTEERSTPIDLYKELDKLFHFTLDPCSTHENAKCKKHFTKEEDWLKQDRNNNIVFMNPPYWKTISQRIEKACNINNWIVVMLLPARTDTKRFQDIILKKCYIVSFLKWRLKFWGSKNSAPFPSMLCIYNPKQEHNWLKPKLLIYK